MKIVSLSFDDNDSVLRVVVEGPFSLAEAKAQFTDVAHHILEHGAAQVLLDGRAVTGEPRTLQRFLYGEFVADTVHELTERGLSRPPQFAYVLIEPVLDPHRLGETVAVNRGVNVKVFDNLPDAEQWLRDSQTQDAGRMESY